MSTAKAPAAPSGRICEKLPKRTTTKSSIMTNQHIRINVTVGSKKNAHCLISVTPRMSYMRPQL